LEFLHISPEICQIVVVLYKLLKICSVDCVFFYIIFMAYLPQQCWLATSGASFSLSLSPLSLSFSLYPLPKKKVFAFGTRRWRLLLIWRSAKCLCQLFKVISFAPQLSSYLPLFSLSLCLPLPPSLSLSPSLYISVSLDQLAHIG